jgi:hypothetical protein
MMINTRLLIEEEEKEKKKVFISNKFEINLQPKNSF